MAAVGFWAGRQLRKVEAAPQSIWASFPLWSMNPLLQRLMMKMSPFEGVRLNLLQYISWKHEKIHLCLIICGGSLISFIFFLPSLVGCLCLHHPDTVYTVFGCRIGRHINSLLLQWWILSWFLQVVKWNLVIFSCSHPKRSNFSNCHFLWK